MDAPIPIRPGDGQVTDLVTDQEPGFSNVDELRVLIVASDPLIRAGLATLLADQPGCTVVGQLAADAGMPQLEREWIAVDLRLRPGHSGGPLVDAHGRLVGINTIMAGPNVGLAVHVHVEFLREKLGSRREVAHAYAA